MEYSSQAKILSLNILGKYRIKSCRIIACTQFSNSINFLYNPDLMTFTSFFIFSKATIKPPYQNLKKSDGKVTGVVSNKKVFIKQFMVTEVSIR